MNHKAKLYAIAPIVSVNYPKIKEKNLVKTPKEALDIFSWIINHLPLVLFIITAILAIAAIIQRVRDQKKR